LTVDGRPDLAARRKTRSPGDRRKTNSRHNSRYGLRVRDDVSRLTGLVNDLRAVKAELKARAAALESRKGEAPIAGC
jgi:hypothetical protein